MSGVNPLDRTFITSIEERYSSTEELKSPFVWEITKNPSQTTGYQVAALGKDMAYHILLRPFVGTIQGLYYGACEGGKAGYLTTVGPDWMHDFGLVPGLLGGMVGAVIGLICGLAASLEKIPSFFEDSWNVTKEMGRGVGALDEMYEAVCKRRDTFQGMADEAFQKREDSCKERIQEFTEIAVGWTLGLLASGFCSLCEEKDPEMKAILQKVKNGEDLTTGEQGVIAEKIKDKLEKNSGLKPLEEKALFTVFPQNCPLVLSYLSSRAKVQDLDRLERYLDEIAKEGSFSLTDEEKIHFVKARKEKVGIDKLTPSENKIFSENVVSPEISSDENSEIDDSLSRESNLSDWMTGSISWASDNYGSVKEGSFLSNASLGVVRTPSDESRDKTYYTAHESDNTRYHSALTGGSVKAKKNEGDLSVSSWNSCHKLYGEIFQAIESKFLTPFSETESTEKKLTKINKALEFVQKLQQWVSTWSTSPVKDGKDIETERKTMQQQCEQMLQALTQERKHYQNTLTGAEKSPHAHINLTMDFLPQRYQERLRSLL